MSNFCNSLTLLSENYGSDSDDDRDKDGSVQSREPITKNHSK